MANLSFKQGDLSNISNTDISNGVVYFSKDDTSGHSAHGYIFYDDEIDRIPINGSGYYIAPEKKDSSKKSMFIEDNLFNFKAGATIGVGCNDYQLWFHRSSNTSNSNRGLWSPLILNEGEDKGSWVLRVGKNISNPSIPTEPEAEFLYLSSPDYRNSTGVHSNTYTVRPNGKNTYHLGDADCPWLDATITTVYGSLQGNASTATILQTPRNLQVGEGNPVSFNGSADVKIPLEVSTTWSRGDITGPKLAITVNGVTSDTITIDSATPTQSGVVTTSSQTFVGDKTFANNTTYFKMTNYDKWGSIGSFDNARWSNDSIGHPGIQITAHYDGQNTDTTTNPDWHIKGIDRVVLSAGANAAFYPTSITRNGNDINRISLGTPGRQWINIYGQNLNIKNLTDSNIKLYWSSDSNLRIGSAEAIVPDRNNAITCGSENYMWKEVYAATQVINPSDIRLKEIQSQEYLNKLIKVYNSLTPIAYKFKNITEQDNYKRIHVGFSAQEVEEKMLENNLTRLDFAGLCIDPVYQQDEEGEDTDIQIDEQYGLRYGEFHGLHMLKNHQQDARLTELENKNKELENTISTLKTQVELLKLAIGG